MSTVISRKQELNPADLNTVNRGIQLESITLSEGNITFLPEESEYTIQVSEGTERIRVKASTFESDSFYTVKGNNNLIEGTNDIVITVTDKDGNSGQYIIHAIVGGEQKEQLSSADGQASENALMSQEISDSASDSVQSVYDDFTARVTVILQDMTAKKYQPYTYGVIGCGVIAVILWMILILKRIRMKRRMRRAQKLRLEQKEQRKQQWELAQRQQEELLQQVDQLLEKKKRVVGVVPEDDYLEEDYPEEDYPENDYSDEEDYPEEDYPENDYPEGDDSEEDDLLDDNSQARGHEEEYVENGDPENRAAAARTAAEQALVDEELDDNDAYELEEADANEEELDRWLEQLNKKDADANR